jgi:hypothetical protein
VTVIFEQVVTDLDFRPDCPHNNTWTTRGRRGGCHTCHRCFHTVVIRENAGSANEYRWCGDCGEDL